jgi:hypothetical protein
MAAPFNKSNGIAQQNVNKIVSLTIGNLVKTKAGTKHELLFNKPTSVAILLNI